MTRPSRNFFGDTFAPFNRFIRTRGEKVNGRGTGTELSELLLLLLMVLARYILAHPPKLGWLIKKITRVINGDCSDINDYVFLCSSWESFLDNPFTRTRGHVHNIIMATHRGCVYAGLWWTVVDTWGPLYVLHYYITHFDKDQQFQSPPNLGPCPVNDTHVHM